LGPRNSEAWRTVLRWILGTGYVAAGILHFVYPAALIAITPLWVPRPDLVVAATGVAEAAGGLALLQPWSAQLRRSGGIGLALYAVCVFPANINHLLIDLGSADRGLGWGYHGPRLLLQPLLIWLALWVSRPAANSGLTPYHGTEAKRVEPTFGREGESS
jgi:uncharacterized membrane protein